MKLYVTTTGEEEYVITDAKLGLIPAYENDSSNRIMSLSIQFVDRVLIICFPQSRKEIVVILAGDVSRKENVLNLHTHQQHTNKILR